MNANALFYCISSALSDESVVVIEVVGLKHTFSLYPSKITDLTTRQGYLWVTKRIGNQKTDQLLINPDHIVYVRVRKEAENG